MGACPHLCLRLIESCIGMNATSPIIKEREGTPIAYSYLAEVRQQPGTGVLALCPSERSASSAQHSKHFFCRLVVPS